MRILRPDELEYEGRMVVFWECLKRDLAAAKSEEMVDFLSRNHTKLKPPRYFETSQIIGRERELMNLYTGQYDLLFSKVETHDLALENFSADRLKLLVQKATSLRCHPEVEKKLQVAQEAVEKGLEWESLDPPSQLAIALLAGAITAWDKHVQSMEKKAS